MSFWCCCVSTAGASTNPTCWSGCSSTNVQGTKFIDFGAGGWTNSDCDQCINVSGLVSVTYNAEISNSTTCRWCSALPACQCYEVIPSTDSTHSLFFILELVRVSTSQYKYTAVASSVRGAGWDGLGVTAFGGSCGVNDNCGGNADGNTYYSNATYQSTTRDSTSSCTETITLTRLNNTHVTALASTAEPCLGTLPATVDIS